MSRVTSTGSRQALEPYPEDEVDTVFLGDFFQGGEPGAGGGAAAATLAMERRNARSVLGNHDLFLLVMLERSRGGDQLGAWRTRDGLSIEDLWLSRRGDWADLDAVASDAELEAWLRALPFLVELEDGTLAQHTDDDRYAEIGDTVDAVNAAVRAWLATRGGAFQSLRYTIGRHGFDDPERLPPLPRPLRRPARRARAHPALGRRADLLPRRPRGRLRRQVLALLGSCRG